MALSYDILRAKERQIESLREKNGRAERECLRLRKENAEFRKRLCWGEKSPETSSGQNCDDENCRKIDSLKSENEDLKRQLAILTVEKNKNLRAENLPFVNTSGEKEIILRFPCDEKNLFNGEIEDYLYDILYSSLEEEKINFPLNKIDENFRKLDIINSLLEKKSFDWRKSETFKRLHDINSSLTGKKANSSDLESKGFIKLGKCKSHMKYCFFKKRYQLTFSLSPSDGNAGKNRMREITKRCFLVFSKRCAKLSK